MHCMSQYVANKNVFSESLKLMHLLYILLTDSNDLFVCLFVFNGTFSTYRLYCAIGV